MHDTYDLMKQTDETLIKLLTIIMRRTNLGYVRRCPKKGVLNGRNSNLNFLTSIRNSNLKRQWN